jgi:hypothetical protein
LAYAKVHKNQLIQSRDLESPAPVGGRNAQSLAGGRISIRSLRLLPEDAPPNKFQSQ